MHIFFLTLVGIFLSLVSISVYFVLGSHDLLMHFFCGLVATVSSLVTHCWVFFYFIGTGEGIREGIIAHKLDESSIKLTKKFKAKTFPFALFSMLFMIASSILGGALRFQKVDPLWHKGMVAFALLFNLFSFFQEYKIIRQNQKLMHRLNEEIEAK